MQPISTSWQESMMLGFAYAIAQVSSYLPRVLAAVLVFIAGVVLSRIIRSVVRKSLEAVRLSRAVERTPLELFLKNAELGQKLEDGLSGVLYWLLLFLTLHTAVSVLGLTPLTNIFQVILAYLPRLFSAVFIFILGVLLAGLAETFVKGSLRGFDPHTGRLFAKISSYLVVIIASLAAVAELGIASQFIMILFVGVIFSLSLALGLAFGLGGRATVEQLLSQWQRHDDEPVKVVKKK